MPELLIFAYDHAVANPTMPAAKLAASPSLFDLIDIQPDGWNWGADEVAHPWFRILSWPQADMPSLQALISPLLPLLDSNGVPTTLYQYRGHYLNGADPAIQAVTPLAAFWNDPTRADPKFFVDPTFTTAVAQLTVARPAIPDPNYPGLGGHTVISGP